MFATRLMMLCLGVVSSLCLAQSTDHPRHRGPPPQALEACKGQSGGAACTFTLGDKTVTGICASGRSDELACRSADGGPGGHHLGPPPEAREACKSVALGAACSFTGRGRGVSGTCEQGPDGEGLACRPAGRPEQER